MPSIEQLDEVVAEKCHSDDSYPFTFGNVDLQELGYEEKLLCASRKLFAIIGRISEYLCVNALTALEIVLTEAKPEVLEY